MAGSLPVFNNVDGDDPDAATDSAAAAFAEVSFAFSASGDFGGVCRNVSTADIAAIGCEESSSKNKEFVCSVSGLYLERLPSPVLLGAPQTAAHARRNTNSVRSRCRLPCILCNRREVGLQRKRKAREDKNGKSENEHRVIVESRARKKIGNSFEEVGR